MKITSVYVMRDLFSNANKIGYSIDPSKRANQIGGMLVAYSVEVGPRRHASAVEILARIYASKHGDKVTFYKTRLHSGFSEMVSGPIKTIIGCVLAALTIYKKRGISAVRELIKRHKK